MIAAALGDISRDLRIDNHTAQIIFSTYFLDLAIGSFVAAAFSEVTGRKGNSKALMITARLMTGIRASGGITVCITTKRSIPQSSLTDGCHSSKLTGPVIADMYGKRGRGKPLAIASFLPYLGPALGPIFGGIIAQLVVWPWIFWIMSIFKSFHNLSVILFHSGILYTMIQLITFAFGVGFGIYTILNSTSATLYIERYNQTVSISALHYIAIAIGAIAASQIGGRIMDWLYRSLSNKNNNHGRPEFRVPYSMDGAMLMPIGLFWYSWVAEVTGPWPVVDIGASVLILENMVFSQGLLAYELYEFGKYGAWANVASRVGSNIMGFILPTFGPQLYEKLGFGWGNSLLGSIWIVSGGPICFVLYYWGKRIRVIGKETEDGSSLHN
ncbi:uncharacterized protein EAF02_009774 [Botrytis sinoallii]|uniref:uncharacterized protein n=1 Tax=Botrytis sinoallii TaxID=1463999 RepID=UPI001900C809|nr:uncharacterized protein EAF02_009774 [Botrytis sinoallii]KAF7866988.1 hypothetical protein EAF02_009774 [Botrytis sinoallii]